MHILILGGGGFLGQKLAKQLITNQSITVNGVPGQITKIELLDSLMSSFTWLPSSAAKPKKTSISVCRSICSPICDY